MDVPCCVCSECNEIDIVQLNTGIEKKSHPEAATCRSEIVLQIGSGSAANFPELGQLSAASLDLPDWFQPVVTSHSWANCYSSDWNLHIIITSFTFSAYLEFTCAMICSS